MNGKGIFMVRAVVANPDDRPGFERRRGGFVPGLVGDGHQRLLRTVVAACWRRWNGMAGRQVYCEQKSILRNGFAGQHLAAQGLKLEQHG